jgi:Uncharacterised nucleotidyltransferase
VGAAELELVLLLARAEPARASAAARIRARAAAADLDLLAADLERRRMLPLLGRRRLAAAPEAVPASVAARVAAAHARDRAAAMALQHETRTLVDALRERGIRALPLKGPGLAERLYGDPGLRSAGDVDLLVRREDLEAATAAMRERGYGAPTADRVDRRGLPHLHFALRAEDRPAVELHWRVHWHEEAFSGALLERAGEGSDGLLAPRPDDEGAALLLFYARDGFYGLRLAADLAAWWERVGEQVGAGFLAPYAERHPALARSWQAAALAAQATSAVPAASWTGVAPRPGRRAALAVRLGCWSQRGEHDQLVANIALVDGLLTPARALPRFLRRQALGAPGALAPHAAKVAARFAVGLWRVRTRPLDPLP